MFEVEETYKIDFETMKAYQSKWTSTTFDTWVLNDVIYMGYSSAEEKCGMISSRPGSWSYFGGSLKNARAAYDAYVTYRMEKAFGLDAS